MDEGGGALVGKVDQSGPRKITASKSVRWPMGGGSGRRQQSGKHQKLHTFHCTVQTKHMFDIRMVIFPQPFQSSFKIKCC